MDNHETEYQQHENDASPEEMMSALLSANRELTSRVEQLTRRLAETGTKLEDDRPVSDQTPDEARQIFESHYQAGKPRIAAIAAAVGDRMSRQANREARKEKALIAFGGEFEKAERVRRLEKELEEAKAQAHGGAIPVDAEDER